MVLGVSDLSQVPGGVGTAGENEVTSNTRADVDMKSNMETPIFFGDKSEQQSKDVKFGP